MTNLQQAALKTTPLPREVVETIYTGWRQSARMRALCESHERLRMELEGAEAMIADLTGATIAPLVPLP